MAKISIKDVAKHAGVSTATVSHVINKTRGVSAETTARVLQSIRELDFHPNYMARSFKTGRSNLIAFVVPDIANSFYASLTEAIQSIIEKEGYQLLLTNTREDMNKELQTLQTIQNTKVDAIILCTTQPDYKSLEPVLSNDIPCLLLDRKFDSCPHDSVTISSYDSICCALEHLLEKGHKKIGYINGLARLSSTRERFSAYHDTMARHGLFDEDLVQTGEIMMLSSSTDPLSLIERGCTAIMCANNVLSIETFHRLIRANVIPGKNVDLIGFKESDILQYELSFMDLIVRPAAALGRKAGAQILQRIARPDLPPREIILEASFQPRSAGPEF